MVHPYLLFMSRDPQDLPCQRLLALPAVVAVLLMTFPLSCRSCLWITGVSCTAGRLSPGTGSSVAVT